MVITRAHFDLGEPRGASDFAASLGLKNLGLTIHTLEAGEGFDFFHNHREQEEIYLCLLGQVTVRLGAPEGTDHRLGVGDIVRVAPRVLRAVGNESPDRSVVLIAGACPHPYPAGLGHHDVIADVLTVTGKGQTGFHMPAALAMAAEENSDEDC